MKILKNFIVVILIATLFTGCKKEDNSITTSNVQNLIVTGSWRVTYYWDTNKDETSNFNDYSFVFEQTKNVSVTKNGLLISGTWNIINDDSKVKLVLNFNAPTDFIEISDDWHVIERTNNRLKLQDVSGGNGGTDYLTFEK